MCFTNLNIFCYRTVWAAENFQNPETVRADGDWLERGRLTIMLYKDNATSPRTNLYTEYLVTNQSPGGKKENAAWEEQQLT